MNQKANDSEEDTMTPRRIQETGLSYSGKIKVEVT
jgi:hypothetical protein